MAKRGSLQAIVQKAQPRYDYGTIVQQLESNLSHQPFVLVEADWDCKLFRRMLNGKHTNLGKAEEKGKSGYHYVEKIVQLVRNQKPNAKVIGIHDRDYTHFDPNYIKPDNIFLTDEHSLETMLIHSQNVLDALEQVWTGFSAGLNQVMQDARHIARYYVFSLLENLNIDFKERKMHLSDFSDTAKCRMQDDWKHLLQDRFFAQAACQGKSEPDLERRVAGAAFYNKSKYEVCRGHDLLDTCYNTIHHGSLTPDDIMSVMINAYTSADFVKTNLCQELNQWAKSVDVVLMGSKGQVIPVGHQASQVR